MATIEAVTTPGAILGAVLSRLRTAKGIKQGDLANAVGIGASTWSRIEKGESGLSIEQLRSVAKALGVSPGMILEMIEAAEKEVARRGVRIDSSSAGAKFSIPTVGGGVAAGIASGAALGTVIPVFGTALGGLIGGAIAHFAAKGGTNIKQSRKRE